jgi:hypothetical protein
MLPAERVQARPDGQMRGWHEVSAQVMLFRQAEHIVRAMHNWGSSSETRSKEEL